MGVIALVAVVVFLNRSGVDDGHQVVVAGVPAVEVEYGGVRFMLSDRDGGDFCTQGWDAYPLVPETAIELAPTLKARPLPSVDGVYVEAYILDAPGEKHAAGTITCEDT